MDAESGRHYRVNFKEKSYKIPGYVPGFFFFRAMKYRALHKEELEGVKDEFVKFLAANSVTAEDWEQLKKEENDKAMKLIDIFSDIFWDKALSKIKALEVRTSTVLRVMQFQNEKVELIELRLPEDATVDLTSKEDLQKISSGEIKLAAIGPEMYTGSKDYDKSREEELFFFLEQGAQPCNENLYYGLKSMLGK